MSVIQPHRPRLDTIEPTEGSRVQRRGAEGRVRQAATTGAHARARARIHTCHTTHSLMPMVWHSLMPMVWCGMCVHNMPTRTMFTTCPHANPHTHTHTPPHPHTPTRSLTGAQRYRWCGDQAHVHTQEDLHLRRCAGRLFHVSVVRQTVCV